ncbi:GtrA family protein [Mycobacterium sherrisii]|uniref:GtrA family protein n=1 Tax=Mycobacterium sherrisii TaxID=243061 RepID=UPI0009FE5D3D|nr:GtrA family protein [Mycobacterium sherrisii]MCV7032612.1 GtrA family protein [Mycobacterium sherrisii]
MPAESRSSASRAVDGFHRCCAAVAARLPFGLAALVAPTFLGFCVINGFTFGLDLALLTTLRGGFGVPVPIAVTVAYACAFALSYVLNRTFNFRSHAAVGPQVAVYLVVVVVNYLAFILGTTSLLAAAGVQYQVARLVAGLCEAVYMYTAMRWLVFRRQQAPAVPSVEALSAAQEAPIE